MIFEAKLIGFKEGIKICLVWLVLYSYLLSKERKELIKPFYAGLALSAAAAFLSLLLPAGLISKDDAGNIISMSFAAFLILSGAALYHASGVNLFFGKGDVRSGASAGILVISGSLLFFLPDFAGSVLYLQGLAILKDDLLMTWASACAGLLIAGIVFFSFMKFYKPYRLGSFFGLPQLFLFLSMAKLFGGGIKGISELSLIPSVQRGFMKFIHDFIHQTFVLLLVPDHPILKKTAWDFIGIFFGAGFASAVSLLLLLSLPALFIRHSLFYPLPEPQGDTNASRRRIWALMLSDRRKKALPVMVFMVFIVAAWFSYGGEAVSKIYKPQPRPLAADGGIVRIPVKDPAGDIMDGRLHKFSLFHEGEVIRIMAVRRSDDSVSVCLDACEICPPDGYGQRDDHLVCVYCGTPIAVDSVGEPGGCNPIPLSADVGERFITIEMSEILKKWSFVNSVKTSEGVK
ncbi:MAG: DUF2318 domain-containing protein [Nitrospirae bacterium]|nr:DUF2318 domain-containing protein [Nitrospirota bacterium]